MLSSCVSTDSLRVRKCFALPSRLADSLFLRREIAARMHERLAMIRVMPRSVLDAGCGEGADLPLLQGRFPGADVIMLDASFGMLLETRKKGDETSGKTPVAVCGDFAALPFANGGFGMLWSNLALHWHPDPFRVFSEWKRVLDESGLLMFSCFGSETFRLLRDAFGRIDGYDHVLPFMEMHDLGDRLVEAGFPSPVLDREIVRVTYGSAARLLSDVRAFGGNPLSARRRTLLGKTAYARLLDCLESQKDPDGKISLPFEIIYGHAFCQRLTGHKKAAFYGQQINGG